jgi:hypothetical protein
MFSAARPLTRSGRGFAIAAAIAAAYAIITIFFAMPKFYHTFTLSGISSYSPCLAPHADLDKRICSPLRGSPLYPANAVGVSKSAC